MSCLGNLIWLVFGGFITGMGYILGGLVVCLTIIGIPFGLQSIKLGVATMTPFGRDVSARKGSGGLFETIFNIFWAIFFGWEIALSHLFWGALFYITIIGIPFGRQHFKLAPLAFFPFGKDI
jgi:uncharacterized membrane protein YccF (DUF307 family)